MKRLFTLVALACVVGSMNLLAQTTETIDFRGFNTSFRWTNEGDNNNDESNLSNFIWDGNTILGLKQEGKERRFSDEGAPTIQISVADPSAWQIGHDSDHEHISYLQRKPDVGNQSVFIHNLEAGDKVYVNVSNNNDCYNVSRLTDTQGQLSRGSFFTMNLPGTVEISVRGDYVGLDQIRVVREEQSSNNNAAEYTYDPGIESYDLYWVSRLVSNNPLQYEDLNAGFPLDHDDIDAVIMANLSDGTPLNKRIAISLAKDGQSTLRPWTFTWRNDLQNQRGNESQGLLNRWSWHNFSVCDLKAGDRVVLTLFNRDYNEEGNVGHAKIGSKQNGGNVDGTMEYHGCAGFMDLNDNGVQDEGEPTIEAKLNLEGHETQYHDLITWPITVTEDGHLDFAFDNNVLLKKVEIYSDHKASMVHKYNGSLEAGYTSYFNITGQLETKQHVIPGGLQVHVGNDDEDQHATVVASAYTPVVTIYDENHYKIARNDNSTGLFSDDLTTNLPTNGTYYKFVPEISGSMDIKFYTSSINYLWPGADGLVRDASNTSNEYANNASCPYYLIDVDANGNIITANTKQIYYNGNQLVNENGNDTNWSNISVVAGHTYYLFGGWQNGATAANHTDWAEQKKSQYVAGVPKLLEVTYRAEKLVYPLAKWVPERTTADDDLATVKGYSAVKIKKMSDNIQSCYPYLQDGKLKIKDIALKDQSIGGGVILIEITDNTTQYDRADPVFAFTVAYDASYNSSSNIPEAQRGHTWDFSTKPLNGLKWKDYYTDGQPNTAVVTSLGTSTDPNSLLSEEMNWTDIHDKKNSDWTFNYRLRTPDGNYDPMFVNNYDMVGDNADMVWDSEGMVVWANFTKNSINNEFTNGLTDSDKKDVVQHTETTDPDRYIGILPRVEANEHSEFLIPWLNKDDRVIIWMGSGTGPESETKEMVFNITNALDAEHNEISPTDNYVAGGSQWNSANSDPYYRGCYHFFAKGDGDMRFSLVDGTMCKIYKIQIYHGDRINTNEIKGATTNDKFLLYSTAVDPNDANSTSAVGPTYNWTLQYFGKDQKIADGSNNKSNEVVARSGVSIPPAGDALTTSTETDPTAATYNSFTYQHALGQIGTFRMRGKDMEKNMKYVADYGEHNVTVAYQQTMEYPYTWDFKDVTGWGNNRQNFTYEDGIGSLMVSKPDYFDSDNDWDASYEKSSKDLSLWELDVQDNTTYYLRLNSQSGQTEDILKEKDNIFETANSIPTGGGNQFWANGAIVPETKGLWFYSMDNNRNNNTWGVTNEGMAFNGIAKQVLNMVVPNVPAGAAVYLRMKTNRTLHDEGYSFMNGNSNCEVYGPTLVEGTSNEYIYAILNKGAKRHLTFSIAGYQLKKIAVSTDPKAIGQTGYATESRAHRIDHTLTSYLTGKNIKAYIADYNSDYSKVLLKEIGSSNTGNKMNLAPSAEDDNNACILYHDGGSAVEGGFTDRTVNLFDGGLFHVFVPDMHDAPVGEETTNDVDVSGNILKSYLPTASSLTLDGLANTDRLAANTISGYTNMILSATKYSVKDANSTNTANGYDVFFIRIDPKKGASMKKCSAYIQMDTDELVKLSTSNNGNGAKMSIVFADDWFGEINNGIATGIDQVTSNKSQVTSAEWYNLNGQKLNGMPTEKGLYIVNGRKVLVK